MKFSNNKLGKGMECAWLATALLDSGLTLLLEEKQTCYNLGAASSRCLTKRRQAAALHTLTKILTKKLYSGME